MVVIVDLDDDPPEHGHPAPQKPLHHSLGAGVGIAGSDQQHGGEATADGRTNPNVNGFSAALSCYP
ncbi:hypothetical protein DM02DRAFT_517649 [Periconia macrospinosa]|uniref:Uncharacterized protein n=1 Tax=Periconia macrospinosa TaxID=97972 RepID=A0A2V1E361_9PLEO|nr:hypothetical protein DM02DRAFT_517649 [Periconia macrospinosa]